MFNDIPVHPGTLFRQKILVERKITLEKAAKHLGVTLNEISDFVNGFTRCTTELAARIAKATDTDVAFWIHHQTQCDIWRAKTMSCLDDVKSIPQVS